MVNLAELGKGLLGQCQSRELADQRLRSFTPLGGEVFEARQRRAADQHPHLSIRPGF
jgi:hypothetical protein